LKDGVMTHFKILRRRGTRLGVILLVFISVAATLLAAFDEQPPLEYQVKAACLYWFPNFVKWPPQKIGAPDSPFIIGVLGKDPFAGALEAVVEGKKFEQHTLTVRHISSPAEARACHLLFISPSEDNRLPAIVKELRDTPVLTVGESEKFLARGGMIKFIIVDNKVRFEINREAAEQAGVHIKSQLMNLVRLVNNQTDSPR
jgi:hypothetical protein